MNLLSLIRLATPYRRSLITVGGLTVGSSLVLLAIPWLAGHMIGDIISRDSTIGRLVPLLLIALVLLTLINIAVSIVSSTTATKILSDLRVRVYGHLQLLPLAFHENHRQGDTLALATFEVARLSQFLTGTLVALPARLVTVVGAVILMFGIDARLAILVPLLVPVFYLILKLVGRRLRGLAVSLQEAEADLVAVTEENLEMLPAIKSFAREQVEAGRYRSRVDRAKGLRIQEGWIYATLEPIIGLIAASAAVLLLFAAGRTLQSGNMSTAELFSFLFYAALLARPVGALANTYGQIQTARGTLARLQSVLETDIEAGYSSTGSLIGVQGHISFAGVGFGYPGRDITLRDVNLEIQAGETVAFTGSNGAGKTTLINLLLRFQDPDRGTIKLDGHDISKISVQDLRRQIGVVPQRPLLFNGSIRANIVYGMEDASDEDLRRAASLSQAMEFIEELPLGLETVIGDHGVRLSGGQRQRIALARALIKDPPVLILDEATSMYDLEGENAFIEASSTALAGRTVLMITHRPASLAIADRNVCIEEGSVSDVLIKAEGVGATQ